MKRVIGVFSLSVMLLTQIITPFAYATGDITPVEETVVEKTVVSVEDTANDDEPTAGDNAVIESEGKAQPETDFYEGDKGDPVEQQGTTGDDAQISGGNSEDNHDVAPVEVQSGTTVEASSGDATKLSGDNENLKGKQTEEKTENGSGEESKTGFLESIKNFLGLGESKEEGKEQKDYEYETKVITGEAEYDDVKVEVYADTGLFYSGTELVIQAVTGDMYEGVKEVLSGQLENIAEEEQTVVAFDISFIYSGEEVQPLTGTVQVTFNYENNEDLKAAEESEEQEVKVYHLNDKDEEGEKIEEIAGATVEEAVVNKSSCLENDEIIIDVREFSIYAIGNVRLSSVNQQDLESFAFTFDAAGGYFNNSESIKIIHYSEESIGDRMFSHTSNINDSGTQNGVYGKYIKSNDTIKIDGAQRLHIMLKYNTETNYDYLYVFKGIYQNDVWSNMNNGQEYTFNGNSSNSSISSDFYIEGDTVTFSFYSDGSVGYYGYYAIIEGVKIVSDDTLEKPQKDGHLFLGWYESGTDNIMDTTQKLVEDKNFYAKWWNTNEVGSENAKLLEGKKFNSIIKTLANGLNPVEYNETDLKITGIEKSNIYAEENDMLLISSEDSETSVIAWYDDVSQKIMYFTKAENVYLDEDSSYMFSKLKNLKSIDMNQFKTDHVANMERMFEYSFSPLEGLELDFTKLNLSNVKNMSYMFHYVGYGYETPINISGVVIDFSGVKMNSLETTYRMFGFMFFYDENIDGIEINFSNTEMKNLIDMSEMFYEIGCTQSAYLTSVSNFSINFSGADLRSVETASKMFHYAFYTVANVEGIKIDFSNVDFSSVVDMNEMFFEFFYGNSSHPGILSGATISFRNSKLNNVENMKNMFNYAFTHMQSVENVKVDFTMVDFLNNNEGGILNMNNMFHGFCRTYDTNSLSGITVDFSGSDLSRVNDMEEMFSAALAGGININNVKIDFGNTDISGVTNMQKMFYNFSYSNYETPGIISGVMVNFRKTKLSRVENMYQMFYYAFAGTKQINNLKIDFSYSEFDDKTLGIDSMVNMQEMFSYFGQSSYMVESEYMSGVLIDFSNANLNRVSDMKSMFYYAFTYLKNLNGVTINFSNSAMNDVINMQEMFNQTFGYGKNISGLIVDFSDSEMNGVKDMNNMFNNFCNLSNASYLGTINGAKIDFNGVQMKSVENMGNMFNWAFSYAKNMSGVSIDFSNVDFGDKNDTPTTINMNHMFYDSYYGYGTDLISGATIDFSNAKMSRVSSVREMFYYFASYAKNVNGILINFKNVEFGDINMERMFYEICYGYGTTESISGVTIDFSNAKMDKVNNMSEMFYMGFAYADNIEGILIDFNGVKDVSSVVSMEKMFFDFCYGYEEDSRTISGVIIDLSNINLTGLVSAYSMFHYAFANGDDVSGITIDLSNVDMNGLTNMMRMFNQSFGKMNRENNDSIKLDLSGVNFGNAVETMMEMFYGFGLETLDLSMLDTSNVSNARGMFKNAENLKTIYASNKFSIKEDADSSDMFNGAISLVGGEGTKYSGEKINNLYAKIDGGEDSPGYFTDKNHFAVRFLTYTGEELKKQWISIGETVNKLEDVHRSYKYYLPGDLQTEFDFKKPLYGYTEIYVVWDDIHLVSFNYGTGIDRGTVSMGGCTVEEGGVGVDKTNNSCEVELPEINSITGYNTPLWYKKGTEIVYSTSKITLTGDVELEAKANANHYTINFKPGTGTGNMNSQEFVYDEVGILNKNSFIKTGYYFSGWIDDNGVEYSNGQKVLNLLTEGRMNLTAQWSLIPPSAGGGSVINNQPTEKEHNSAELTGINKEIEVEQVKPQPTKTNTNTTKESTKQESSTTHSSTSQSQIDPEILTAYEWAKSKDITTIQTLDEAMPDGVVKRGHLAKMVVNYATNILGREIPEKIPSECRWNDNRKDRESDEIKDYAVKSCALGLMGLDMERFQPNLNVTRAQFGTIMSRLLWGKKYAGGTPYYRNHLNALKENNIMTQLENPENRVELRQWVWVMLMRSAENK